MPNRTPKKQLIPRATTESSMVAGNRCLTSTQTFWRVQMVSPRSPFIRRCRNIPYWTCRGSLSPRCSRISARAWSVARSPSSSSAGSPGRQAQHEKNDDGNAQQGGNQDHHPSNDVCQHGTARIWDRARRGRAERRRQKARCGGALRRLGLPSYFIQTFFIRTEAVGWSLKFTTFLVAGQITVEWAMLITGHSS